MRSKHERSGDALLAWADRAIAEAVATRAEVRAALSAAGRKPPHRPWAGEMRPSAAPPLDPLSPADLLEPWWSVARALISAGEIIRETDSELDRGWHRILPSIQTPLATK